MNLLRSIFLDNLLLKLLALAIAVSLVISKRVDRVIRVKKMVGLELKYPDDRVLISVLPPQIELSLEGPYGLIRQFEEERRDTPFKAYRINFNGSENGIYNFQRDYYALPPGLKLNAISPSSMVVRFDEKLERRVPVTPYFVGELPNGFRMKEKAVTPDFVTVVGAKTVLEDLDKAETLPVQLAGRTESGIYEIGLRDPPLFVRYTIDSPRVNLRMDVEELLEEKVFENIPIALKGDPGEQTLKITPSKVAVAIKGPLRILEQLSETAIKPFVEIGTNQKKEVQVAAVKLEPIEGVASSAINPNKVSLVVVKTERRTTESDKDIQQPPKQPTTE